MVVKKMVVKKEVATENLKPLINHCVNKAIRLIDTELRNFILGEKKSYWLTEVFLGDEKQNIVLRTEVVETLLKLYTDAGWKVEQAPDNEDVDVVLTFE